LRFYESFYDVEIIPLCGMFSKHFAIIPSTKIQTRCTLDTPRIRSNKASEPERAHGYLPGVEVRW